MKNSIQNIRHKLSVVVCTPYWEKKERKKERRMKVGDEGKERKSKVKRKEDKK